MDSNIKNIIKQEYLKCASDPVHFMKKYCFIQHPQYGRIKFDLYPFQEKVLKLFSDNPYTFILKSRQLGLSTLTAGYSLWMMTFNKDKNVLCIATKQDTAKNMVTKVKIMYDNLPSWMKVGTDENNKLTLKLSNGSQIKAISAVGDAGRSESVSLLLVDEAAFIDNIKDIWTSSQQTLATGGECIILSTPNGIGNWFHIEYVKAEEGKNNFLPIKLPWFVHPERDQSWRDAQDLALGERMAAQECDCDFNTSGDTVFLPEWLDYMKNTTLEEPIEKRGVHKDLWIWEPAFYDRDYLITADVARGDGKDYSTAQVMDIETNTQVAEYKGQLPPKEFGYFLVGLATEYNNALLAPENASIAWSTLDAIIERGYRNLYFSAKSDTYTADSYEKYYEDNSGLVPGFTNSQRTRPLCVNKFREMMRENAITIKSKRLYEEMKVFLWINGKPQARRGYNDDLVMAMAINSFLRDTSLRFQQKSLDMVKATLGSFQNSTTLYQGYNGNHTTVKNPYQMEVNGNNVDIKWLLK